MVWKSLIVKVKFSSLFLTVKHVVLFDVGFVEIDPDVFEWFACFVAYGFVLRLRWNEQIPVRAEHCRNSDWFVERAECVASDDEFR